MPQNCTAELYAFMSQCWKSEPRMRPDIFQIVSSMQEKLINNSVSSLIRPKSRPYGPYMQAIYQVLPIYHLPGVSSFDVSSIGASAKIYYSCQATVINVNLRIHGKKFFKVKLLRVYVSKNLLQSSSSNSQGQVRNRNFLTNTG